MKRLENLNELVGKTIKSITHDGKDGIAIETTNGANYNIGAVYNVGYPELEFTEFNNERNEEVNSLEVNSSNNDKKRLKELENKILEYEIHILTLEDRLREIY